MKISQCARCGDDHDDVEPKLMAQPFAPPEADGLAWTHWAPCPTNGDPILFMITRLDGMALPEDTALPGKAFRPGSQ